MLALDIMVDLLIYFHFGCYTRPDFDEGGYEVINRAPIYVLLDDEDVLDEDVLLDVEDLTRLRLLMMPWFLLCSTSTSPSPP